MDPSMLMMDGLDLGFDDIVDEVEEDICLEDDLDEDEDICFASTGGDSGEDDMFDAVVGALEEIIMDEDFNSQTDTFMQTNCVYFERGEEMKLEYTSIFQQYTQLIETHLEKGLKEAFPDLAMEEFMSLLEARHEEIGEDLMELLLGMSDFENFRSQMVDWKEQLVEKSNPTMMGICPVVSHVVMHTEDMEDGEERMDLMDFGLDIKPLSPTGVPGDRPPPFGAVPFGRVDGA